MTAFEVGWSVLKAPLDLDSILETETDGVFHADHYDRQNRLYRLIAEIMGEGAAEVAAYGPSGEGVGSLTMFSWDNFDLDRNAEAQRMVQERMGLDENPFELVRTATPEEYTEDELDEIGENYEAALDMIYDYSAGSDLNVVPEYQRRGIATAMRDLLSELNDRYLDDQEKVDMRPDVRQSKPARLLWAANQNDPNYRDRLHEIYWRGLRERMGEGQ